MTPQPVRSFSSREKTRSREKARKARKRTPGHLFIPFPSSQNACAFSRFANPRSRPISALADLPDHFPRERPNGQIRRSRGKKRTDRCRAIIIALLLRTVDVSSPAPARHSSSAPRPGSAGSRAPEEPPPGLGCRRSLGAPLRPPLRGAVRAPPGGGVPSLGARVVSCHVIRRPGAPTAPVDAARASPCRTRCTGRRTRPPGWTTR